MPGKERKHSDLDDRSSNHGRIGNPDLSHGKKPRNASNCHGDEQDSHHRTGDLEIAHTPHDQEKCDREPDRVETDLAIEICRDVLRRHELFSAKDDTDQTKEERDRRDDEHCDLKCAFHKRNSTEST